MRFSRLAQLSAVALSLVFPATAAAASSGGYVLTATSRGGRYAPTFTGNGRLGVRVPPSGQGYAGGNVPSQSELAGFYAKPTHPVKVSDAVQQRSNIPTWSTLSFGDGGSTFAIGTGRTTHWRQSIDFHTGIVTTSALWQAPDGHRTKLTYQVLTDRAQPAVGLVRLTVTPQWSGPATVTDLIDGSPATLADDAGKGFNPTAGLDYVSVAAQTTGIKATEASRLVADPSVGGPPAEVDQTVPKSIGQRLSFAVSAGHSYTFTKYVGVADSQSSADPVSAAQTSATGASSAGWNALLSANRAAWAQLWAGRIDVLGDRTLATDVNASQFYLWSSTRDGVDWSISPAGLSSNGYDGHIFWDAETWMYPSLLAQHPDLAARMNAYRFQRLSAAEQHAQATGYQGARFPWESALDGTEQIPPPVSVNSEGLYEQHITADIALAQWQYYLATGDRSWLATQGWPVLSQAATFWASRAVRGSDGRYHINNVTGPDEENPDVNDEVFTNVGARTTLLDAVQAAGVLGLGAPAAWSQIANGLVIPVNAKLGIHPEFSGYRGQLVKQADVTLLQYPWAYPMPRRIAVNDITFYVPRTDPMGPSMSDAVNTIDNSTLRVPGCASFVYTERSYQPFIRDVFDQFSETSTGGAFTFMTGIGGFLQEFLYGYSGLRFGSDSISFAPTLNGQFGGEVLRQLSWQGRRFTVRVGRKVSTLTMWSGAPMTVVTAHAEHRVAAGQTLRIRTARPDLSRTADLVRCDKARASSVTPGAPALAAVDGSRATDWEPARIPAALTLPVRGRGQIRHLTLTWGRQWPAAPHPNVPPPPRPVITRRPTRYELLVSTNGRRWRHMLTVTRRSGTVDRVRLRVAGVRYLRLRILAAPRKRLPLLEELTATR